MQAWRDYSDRYAAGNPPSEGTDIREAFAAGWDAALAATPERPAGLDVERLAAVINDGIRNGRSDHEIARDVLALAALETAMEDLT